MKARRLRSVRWTLLAGLLMVSAVAADARAQSSSLYGSTDRRHPLTLADHSWTYQPMPHAREIKLYDVVTVIVSEKSQVISEGEMDRRKKADGMMVLKDWIVLDGLAIRPDPQSAGDPKISGEMSNKYRAESGMETRDAMRLTIACQVVDIRPNGHLILEGRRAIRNNNEVWEQSLTGIIRPEDVLENNTVLSENVAELRIHKRESGHVRDGYRRGWLLKWLDTYQPF